MKIDKRLRAIAGTKEAITACSRLALENCSAAVDRNAMLLELVQADGKHERLFDFREESIVADLKMKQLCVEIEQTLLCILMDIDEHQQLTVVEGGAPTPQSSSK